MLIPKKIDTEEMPPEVKAFIYSRLDAVYAKVREIIAQNPQFTFEDQIKMTITQAYFQAVADDLLSRDDTKDAVQNAFK